MRLSMKKILRLVLEILYGRKNSHVSLCCYRRAKTIRLWCSLPGCYFKVRQATLKWSQICMKKSTYEYKLKIIFRWLKISPDKFADLKIRVRVHIKIILWKFRILNPRNSRVVYPESLRNVYLQTYKNKRIC